MSTISASFLLLILFLFSLYVSVRTENCAGSLTDKDGVEWHVDLKGAAKDGGFAIQPKDPSAKGGDYNYVVNFCKAVATECTKVTGQYKSLQVSKDKQYCYYLSALESADDSKIEFRDASNPKSGGVILTYTDGQKTDEGNIRQTEITLNCDEKADTATIDFNVENDIPGKNIYKFTANSKWACGSTSAGPSKPLGELGVGGLLIILAGVGLVIYFIVGILICKLKLKKTGVEIIPNVHFWKDIPFLLKDGVMLIVDLVMKITKRGKYQELSDPKV